jgi:hypothetical protein
MMPKNFCDHSSVWWKKNALVLSKVNNKRILKATSALTTTSPKSVVDANTLVPSPVVLP